MSTDANAAPIIISHLRRALLDLVADPCPVLPSPENVKKRASVALIIRVQPHNSHWPAPSSRVGEIATPDLDSSPEKRIDDFFGQEWVRFGSPEVLFIRRAAREGDRWTGQVALPGGRRDPEDESDLAAAIRETREEVGVELTDSISIPVGNLPQRLVSTSWGKVPLMVLCPYVFLLTRHHIPLRLQPTEINSAHWVSLPALLSPYLRTFEYQDVSNRLAKQEMGIRRWILRAMLGRMLFAAIRLVPSESTYCTSVPGFLPESNSILENHQVLRTSRWKPWWINKRPKPSSTAKPLLLWGITLGIMADFLELLPPHNALALWTYPTFSPPDVRFTLWAMSYSFRKKKRVELEESPAQITPAVEQGVEAVPLLSVQPADDSKPSEVGIGGLGVGTKRQDRPGSRSSAVGFMLEGYYDIVRRAVAVALVGRASMLVAIAAGLWHNYNRR